MEIIYEISGTVLTAQLFGELDHHEAEKTRKGIDGTAARYEAQDLIMDFSRVTFMDSAGIGVVLGRYKKRMAAGGRLVIAGCSQKVHSILAMAGVFSVIPYMETKDEAMEFLKERNVL